MPVIDEDLAHRMSGLKGFVIDPDQDAEDAKPWSELYDDKHPPSYHNDCCGLTNFNWAFQFYTFNEFGDVEDMRVVLVSEDEVQEVSNKWAEKLNEVYGNMAVVDTFHGFNGINFDEFMQPSHRINSYSGPDGIGGTMALRKVHIPMEFDLAYLEDGTHMPMPEGVLVTRHSNYHRKENRTMKLVNNDEIAGRMTIASIIGDLPSAITKGLGQFNPTHALSERMQLAGKTKGLPGFKEHKFRHPNHCDSCVVYYDIDQIVEEIKAFV